MPRPTLLSVWKPKIGTMTLDTVSVPRPTNLIQPGVTTEFSPEECLGIKKRESEIRFRGQNLAQERGESRFVEFAALYFRPKYDSLSKLMNPQTLPSLKDPRI
jgi:hypothetical protein